MRDHAYQDWPTSSTQTPSGGGHAPAWQIVPEAFFAMITDKDAIKSERAMRAMMHMKKLDLPALQRAYDGH